MYSALCQLAFYEGIRMCTYYMHMCNSLWVIRLSINSYRRIMDAILDRRESMQDIQDIRGQVLPDLKCSHLKRKFTADLEWIAEKAIKKSELITLLRRKTFQIKKDFHLTLILTIC